MITINIPDTVEVAIKLPEKERKKELLKLLAVKLYEKGIIGIGKAVELCEMTKLEFMRLLEFARMEQIKKHKKRGILQCWLVYNEE